MSLRPIVKQESTSPLPLFPAQNRSITAADDNTEDLDEAETTKSSTRYLSPDWLKTLKKEFHRLVIDKCSYKVRQSVTKNEKIVSIIKKKEVRKEIIDGTLAHILEVFGGVNKPLVAEMREVVFELSFL